MITTMILAKSKRLIIMKKMFLISAALLALVACHKESHETSPAENPEDVVLTFMSEKPALDSESGTKTAWDSETSSIIWSNDDKIRVAYTLDGQWMGAEDSVDKSNVKFYASKAVSIDPNNASIGTFTVPISDSQFKDPEEEGEYTFYTLYPSTAAGTTINATALNISIPDTQTPESNSFDRSSDLLIGKTEKMSSKGLPTEPIGINWTRLVAHAQLTFRGIPVPEGENENLLSVIITTNEGANISGNVRVNLEENFDLEGSSNKMTINGTNLKLDNENNVVVWVSVLPVTFTGLTIEIKTNKATYVREITGIEKTFKQNARNILAVNMKKAIRKETAEQLVENGYYVISYNDKMMTVGTETDAYRGHDDLDTDDPDNSALWKIEYVSKSDAYTITSVAINKVLYGSTSGSGTSLSFTGGTASTNLFVIDNTDGVYKISPLNNNSRSIGYNITSPRFALYSSTNTSTSNQPTTLTLTKIELKPAFSVKSPLNVFAEEETYSIDINRTNFTGAITVSIPDECDWVESNNVAENSNTLEIFIHKNDGDARTVTLTLSGEGVASQDIVINQSATRGDNPELQTIVVNSGDVINGTTYGTHTKTVSGIDWIITYGGFDNSVGTNSKNRDNCNLSDYPKYAVSPVTSSSMASVFANTLPISYVSKIQYTFDNTNSSSNGNDTKVYLLYSKNNNDFEQIALTAGEQGSPISSGTTFEFEECSGYFAVLFESTNTDSSKNWRVDNVTLTFNPSDSGNSGEGGDGGDTTDPEPDVANIVLDFAKLKEHASKGVSSYTSTWEMNTPNGDWIITNFNNNNNGWNYIKCGSKNADSEAMIDTKQSLSGSYKKVIVTINNVLAEYVDSSKLIVASDSGFNEDVQESVVDDLSLGDISFPVSNPVPNAYYRLVFKMKTSKDNGPLWISKVVYSVE